MNSGSNLPFAPHLYEMKAYIITSTSINQRICGVDSKRVYLSIWEPSNPIIVNPFISFMQSSGFSASRPFTSNNFVEITEYDHIILQTFEIYVNNYPIGSNFSVIEVLYNLPNSRGNQNDTHNVKSLSDKIKDFVFSVSSTGRKHNGQFTVKP